MWFCLTALIFNRLECLWGRLSSMKDSSSWLCHKFLKGRKCTLNISAKTDAILNNCKPNEASCEGEHAANESWEAEKKNCSMY